MPAIILFNRRWGFGSDDLVFPGLLEIIFRSLWLLAVTAVYIHHRHGFVCSTGHLLSIIYQVMIAVLVVQIVSAVSVVYGSTRGTILDTRSRRAVPVLIYIKLFLVIPEVIWIIISLYWAFQSHGDCSFDAVLTVKAAILTEGAVAVVVVVGTAILFDPVGELSSSGDRKKSGLLAQKTRKVWEKRIKLLFCCLTRDEHSRMAFKDIAQHITVFFKDMDMVPTDIAAGLILLYHHEETRRQTSLKPTIAGDRDDTATTTTTTTTTATSSQAVLSDTNHCNNTHTTNNNAAATANITGDGSDGDDVIDVKADNPRRVNEELLSQCRITNELSAGAGRGTSIIVHEDWTRITVLVHYMRYALGCYGWPFYCMFNPRNGCCQLFGCCRCCCCCRHEHLSAASVDDNCFLANTRAILELTGLEIQDVLYASFHNDVYEVPFYVALDHRYKAVVVAIRGTMSIWDVLTDLTSGSEDLDVVDEDGAPCKGHKGMAQAAKYVVSKLNELGLLTEAFSSYPGYHLVVTGHSLGAGTATIVTLMLRDKYPDVKCYAYSPPPSLSRPMVERVEEFVCSVVVGEDLVARLSFLTMVHLRDKVHQQLRHTRQPKYKILASGLWYILCGLPCVLERSLFRRDDAVSDSSHAPLLNNANSHDYAAFGLTTDDEDDDEPEAKICRLYPPGKIYHITNYTRFRREKAHYCWAKPLDFDEIIVHPMMLFDHLPDVVYHALRRIEKQTASDQSGDENC